MPWRILTGSILRHGVNVRVSHVLVQRAWPDSGTALRYVPVLPVGTLPVEVVCKLVRLTGIGSRCQD